MFTVVHQNSHQSLWAPVNVSETVYVGSIIGVDTATPTCGVRPLPVASGAANVTNLDVPLGVVIGTNATGPNKVYNSTYKTEYITAGAEAAGYGNTTQYEGVEGPMRLEFAMVQYIPITSETVIRGRIFNAAYGTAMTTLTVTSGSSATGLDFTSNANESTTVANFATMYCRTGANMGQYRIVQNASSTAFQNSPAFKTDIAVGDTFVVANGLRPFGMSRCYIDAEGMYIDNNAELTANYLLIDVVRLDLSVSGEEYVEFRFNPVNFQPTVRLNTTA